MCKGLFVFKILLPMPLKEKYFEKVNMTPHSNESCTNKIFVAWKVVGKQTRGGLVWII
jgi:hypothetical protein